MTYHLVVALVGDKDEQLTVDQFMVKWHDDGQQEPSEDEVNEQAANLRAKVFGINAKMRGVFKKRGDTS